MHAKSLSEADRTWIKSLARSEGGPGRPVMTEEDEVRLATLVKEHGLPCVMFSSDYGFAICVYDIPRNHGDAPEGIACMTGYLAFPKKGSGEADLCFHIAGLFTHTPENTEILAYYGLPKQREDFGEEFDMAAVVRGESDGADIFLDGGPDNVAGGTVIA